MGRQSSTKKSKKSKGKFISISSISLGATNKISHGISKITNTKFGAKGRRLYDKFNRTCMINPDSVFKKLWDNFIIVLTIYIATVTPFKLSFLDESNTSHI